MNLFLYFRDIAKFIILSIKQFIARLVYIKRKSKSSISLSARLDIYGKNSFPLILGKRSFIEHNCVINSWIGTVEIGDNTGIGINSILIGPITIGDNTRIAQNCFITGENRIRDSITNILKSDQFDIRPVKIGHNVWIGAGVTVLPGVTIEDNAIIGAGSVVTKNVKRGSTVVGNPIKEINS